MGINYYRIKSILTNNYKVYSTIVKVEMTEKGIKNIVLYLNQIKSSSYVVGIQLKYVALGKCTAKIYDALGKQVYSSVFINNGNNSSTSIVLKQTLAAGSYQLQRSRYKW